MTKPGRSRSPLVCGDPAVPYVDRSPGLTRTCLVVALLSVSLGFALAAPLEVAAHGTLVSYARVGTAGENSIPNPNYSYNDAGLGVSSRHIATGRYKVVFYGLEDVAGVYGPYGHVQVTAYGETAIHCQVSAWAGDAAWVDCFDMAGSPIDGQFTVSYFKDQYYGEPVFWMWGNEPTTPFYSPSTSYARNPLGDSIGVTRVSTGVYDVEFISSQYIIASEPEHVQVSAYGTTPAICKYSTLITEGARVHCFDMAGAPVDATFTLLWLKLIKPSEDLAYARIENPLTSPQTASWSSSVGGSVEHTRNSVGEYLVEFTGFPLSGGVDLGTVLVTARGTDGVWCKVAEWNGADVEVRCFDTAGAPADSDYEIFYHTTYRRHINQEYAFGHYWASTDASQTPSFERQYNAGHGDVSFTRQSMGRTLVQWPGMDDVGSDGGAVLITAQDPDRHCKPSSWSSQNALVLCFDRATGAAVDAGYDALFWKPTDGTEGVAYAWANSPGLASHTPSASYAHNPSGGAIAVDRVGPGHHEVTWTGYGATVEYQGNFVGHPVVSAYGQTNHRCNTGPMHADGDTIEVYCFDAVGNPADTPFVALYLKADIRATGLGYSWADLATTSIPYPPLVNYGFGPSYDTSTIEHERSGPGDYVARFFDLGFVGHGRIDGLAMITARESADIACGGSLGHPSQGTRTLVDCTDRLGNPVDARYDTMILKPHAAPEPSLGASLVSTLMLLIALARRRTRRASALIGS